MAILVLDEAAEAQGKPLWQIYKPTNSQIGGRCPECGERLFSNLYYVEGEGYLLCWECCGSRQEEPTCRYRYVL